jgi:proton-dependent oligopeptide transporter, POT family
MMLKHDSEEDSCNLTLEDVRQLALWAALGSLGYVFWVVGGMELIERLAYDGVRTVSTIYVTSAKSDGGLAEAMVTFGWLSFAWYLMQMGGAIFTGGISDRHGYRKTIFVSTLIKCSGYLLMMWLPFFWGFFTGAMFLAFGMVIFKPRIQGTLILATSLRKSSVVWGGFYQIVYIGGWLGPLIALQMRQTAWSWFFYTNAVFICLNLLLLLTNKEPGIGKRLTCRAVVNSGVVRKSLISGSLSELKNPVLYLYLLIFSLCFYMFPMIWDVLPKYVENWVDTSSIVKILFGPEGTRSAVAHFLLGMMEGGLTIEPEGIVNINSGMITLTCFLFAGLSAKMRATTSLLIGTISVVVALVLIGLPSFAWICVAGMAVFRIGEMLASSKFSEFLGKTSPAHKKAMWIGFSQIPILVGQTMESKLVSPIDHMFSEKNELARKMLIAKEMDPVSVTESDLPVGETFQKLIEFSGSTSAELNRILYVTNHEGFPWCIFACLGMYNDGPIWAYGRWFRKFAKNEKMRAASCHSTGNPFDSITLISL